MPDAGIQESSLILWNVFGDFVANCVFDWRKIDLRGDNDANFQLFKVGNFHRDEPQCAGFDLVQKAEFCIESDT